MPRHTKMTSTYRGGNYDGLMSISALSTAWRLTRPSQQSRLAAEPRSGSEPVESLTHAGGRDHTGEHVGRAPAGHGPTSLRRAADQGDETTRAKRLAQASDEQRHATVRNAPRRRCVSFALTEL